MRPQLTNLSTRPFHPRSLPSPPPTQPQQRPRRLQSQDHRAEAVRYNLLTTPPIRTDESTHRYCVRPNSGRIQASGSVEVQVLLQAMKEDPPMDARCRDKFLVQSVAVPAAQLTESSNVAQIWANIESTAKSSIQEKKIRVTFLPAEGQVNGVGGLENSMHEEHPPAYSSPTSPSSAAAVTPQRSRGQPDGAVSTFDEKPLDAKSRADAVNDAHNPATQPRSSFGSAVSGAIPTNQDDLRRQLDAAKAQISQLQEQATEGLRKRNVIGGGEKSESSSGGLAQRQAPAGGVPVQIVAGLCLLCFLIAYFFF